jgi:hypothetical protein
VNGGRRRDVGFLDKADSLLELALAVLFSTPVHPPEHILTGEEKAVLEPGSDHRRKAPA